MLMRMVKGLAVGIKFSECHFHQRTKNNHYEVF